MAHQYAVLAVAQYEEYLCHPCQVDDLPKPLFCSSRQACPDILPQLRWADSTRKLASVLQGVPVEQPPTQEVLRQIAYLPGMINSHRSALSERWHQDIDFLLPCTSHRTD